MLCEHCKMREATVKYVEVINGVKTEHNLCAQCASRVDLGQYSALFEGEFSLGKLLSGLLGRQDAEKSSERFAGVVCPSCHTTYEEFVRNSQFGCPDCYSVFDPLIGENIKHLQGSVKHVGKRPKTAQAGTSEGASSAEQDDKTGDSARTLPVEDQLRQLQTKLQDAVRREDFAEAAALRDEIHKLKEKTLEEETKQDGEVV